MKQRWRHLIASALALALCLSAAACGKSDDTAGDDWRASGAVVDSGTIPIPAPYLPPCAVRAPLPEIVRVPSAVPFF